jgi:hypothetical protein
MNRNSSEVSLEKLVSLARDAGTSAHEELPGRLQDALMAHKARDTRLSEAALPNMMSKLLMSMKP